MCNVVRDSGPGETPVTGRELAPQNLPRALPPAPFGVSAATPKPSAANACGAPGGFPETSSPAGGYGRRPAQHPETRLRWAGQRS